MKTGQKIREIRLARNMKLAEVENLAGIANGNLSRIERGEQWISEDKLDSLADALGVVVADFFSGESKPETLATLKNLRAIPVISTAQASALAKPGTAYAPDAGSDVVYINYEISTRAFALKLEDESMLPEFRAGDVVIIDPDLTAKPGDFVVAKCGRQEATFKKYRPRELDDSGEMIFELSPLNSDYPSLRSDVQKLGVIGVMTEHRKMYKK
ncbi:LexA family transcriptional regulator [Herbaspirillum lusitanum]|uniref:LexA family transcriptional regulator n=1 Tax=Herbaspirillum lusitanum TaxID=213312 RepID=A0ABW9AH52_9BURK